MKPPSIQALGQSIGSNEMIERRAACRVPACKSRQPGGCSTCTLAYDCVSLQRGRIVPWPVVGFLVLGVMAFFV